MDRYEKALAKARAGKSLEEIFPELKESEDEKIRKWLIEEIKATHDYDSPTSKKCVDDALAWLEKQKENPDRVILIGKAKSEKQVVLLAESNGDENIYWDTKSEEDAVSLLEKGLKFFGKQNPAEWSEEDKEMVRRAIFYTEQYRTNYGDTKESEECFNWLLDLHRNIRPPFHWRPSGDQMEALAWYSGNSGVPPTGDKAIKSLYNDLKAL